MCDINYSDSDIDSLSNEKTYDSDREMESISDSYFNVVSIESLSKKNKKLKKNFIKTRDYNEILTENLSISKKTIVEMNKMINELNSKVFSNEEIKQSFSVKLNEQTNINVNLTNKLDEQIKINEDLKTQNKKLENNKVKFDTQNKEFDKLVEKFNKLEKEKEFIEIKYNNLVEITSESLNEKYIFPTTYYFFLLSISGICLIYNQNKKI